MSTSTIPYEFIRDNVAPTWEEMLWGYDHQLVGWSTLVDLATDKVAAGSNNPTEIDLAGIQKNEAWKVGKLVRTHAKDRSTEKDRLRGRI
jgi:hypothetical protein